MVFNKLNYFQLFVWETKLLHYITMLWIQSVLCIFSVQTLFSWGLTAKMKGHVSSSISQFCALFRKRRGVEGPVFLFIADGTRGTRGDKGHMPSPPIFRPNYKLNLVHVLQIASPDFQTFRQFSSRPAKEQPWLFLGAVFQKNICIEGRLL